MTDVLKQALLKEDVVTLGRLFNEAGFDSPLVEWNPSTDMLPLIQLKFLNNFYRNLPRNFAFPDYRHITPEALKPVLGYLMVLDRLDNKFRYRLYGSEIARASGFDMSGKTVDRIGVNTFTPKFFIAGYDAVIERRESLYTQHQAPIMVSVYHWSRLILPFCDDEGVINRFLVGNIPGPRREGKFYETLLSA